MICRKRYQRGDGVRLWWVEGEGGFGVPSWPQPRHQHSVAAGAGSTALLYITGVAGVCPC